MAWKILITDGLEKVGKDLLDAHDEGVDKKGIEADELLQVIPEYDAVIVRGRTKVTADVLNAGTKLKAVGRMGVGVDNIDLEAAKARGITVVNAPVSTSQAVAELALGMLFCLARELPRGDATMKAETWAKKEFNGVELDGKTLGLIGFGNIGRVVGKVANALGMKVLAYVRTRPPEYVRANGAEPATLDEIYQQADFISLHLPLTEESRNMLNDETFAKMKDGVRIVNTARGGVIDEPALLRALESGKVAGVAMDVHAKEPPVDWALAKHPKVVAMPHVGGQTNEAQLRAAVDIASEILNVLNGEPLRWKVV
ncbi:MAG: hydroxyacid dehydrogenase [Anaerolineaceae bacterium]|jgi:D-3-phosphoglycerate dehydrogenase